MNNANWWANKLGAPTPQQPAPMYQPPQPAVVVPAPVQQPPMQPQPQLPPSATASRCPGCGSGNYVGGNAESPGARSRCYDCGYPITQSGSGVKGINQGQASAGPAQATKQVATGGWNPTTIIGKIE